MSEGTCMFSHVAITSMRPHLFTSSFSRFGSFGLLLNILLVVTESLYFLCLLFIATRS